MLGLFINSQITLFKVVHKLLELSVESCRQSSKEFHEVGTATKKAGHPNVANAAQ